MNNKEHTTIRAAMIFIHADEANGGDYDKGMGLLDDLLKNPPVENERRYFRWAYAAIVALAKRHLRDMNDTRQHEKDWPAGQQWEDLGGSSKAIFMRKARDEAGIPDGEFLAVVRGGEVDVDDLFG